MIFNFKDNSLNLFDTQIKSISDIATAFNTLGSATRNFQIQEVGCALATQNLTKEQYAQMTASLSLSGETTKLSAAKIQEAAATAGVSEAQAGGIITTLGLDAATKSYTASAITAKAAAIGLNMAVGMFAGILLSGLFTGIGKIVEKVKEWSHQDEQLAESIKDLRQETADITDELNKLNAELETTKARIDEINSSGNINITDINDLSNLKEQNELLEAQIALKQKELELKNQETNKQIEKWYQETWKKDTHGDFKVEERDGIIGEYYYKKTEEDYIKEQIHRANEIYRHQRELDKQKLSLSSDEISTMSKDQLSSLELTEQEKQELQSIQKYLTSITVELNQQISGYTAITDEQKAMLDYWNSIIIKAAEYSSYQMWNGDSTQNSVGKVQSENIQNISDILKSASTYIDDFQSRITSTFEAIHSQSELTSTDIINLMKETSEWNINFDWNQFGVTGEKGVGNLSAALQALGETLYDHAKNTYPELATQLDEIYTDASKSADAFGTLETALQSLANHHQVLTDVETAIKDTGSLSAEICSSILEVYPQMESVVNDYLQGVATMTDVYHALSEAYNGDLDAYYQCILAKKELDYSFYKQVYDNLPIWVQEYLSAYQKDFGNFKNLAEAKIALQKQFLQLQEISSLNSNDTTYLNYVRSNINAKKNRLQDILEIIQDTELNVSGIKEPTFNINSNKNSNGKNTSIKEIDWAAHSINNLSHSIEYLNNVIDNSNSYKERDSYLKQLISSQQQYNDALTEQANLYKARYLYSVNKIPGYRGLIESGITFKVDQFINQDDLYEAITKAQELYKSWKDVCIAQQDATKSLKDYKDKLDNNWIEHLASEISLVQNEIDNLDSDISVNTEFHIIGDNKEILNNWKKDKYEQLLDLSSDMQLLLEQKFANYQRRLRGIRPETDEYYELQDNIFETKRAINDCIQNQREYNSAILSLPLEQYQKQLDLIDKHIDILNKAKDKYSDYIGAVTYSIDQEIKSVTDSKENTEKYYESLIKPIQDQLDILQKTNNEREKALALQQAYYDLEKAENDLSVKTYVEGQGFIYRPNEDAVREAQNAVDSALYDKAVDELEKQIKEYEDVRDALIADYDDELDRLNDLNDSWSEIISQIEAVTMINEFKLKFGDSTLTRIIDGQDTSTIHNITKWVSAIQGELDTLEIKKGNLEDVISVCEFIVDSYEDGSIDVDAAMNKIDDVVAQHTKSITALNQEHINSVIELGNEYKNSLFNFGDSEEELTDDTEDNTNKMRSIISRACSQIKDVYNNLSNFMSSFRNDMVSDIRSIGDAASEMASDIASSASRANSSLSSINTSAPAQQTTTPTASKAVSLGGAVIAGISTVIGMLFKHDGMESGLVSKDQSEENRDSVFKRIALDDLKANEVPAVLQVGEAVLTKKQQDNVVHNMIAGVDYGMSAVKSMNKTSNVNVNIPEIHLHEIQNVDSFAKEISKTFKTKLIQEVRK